MTEELKPCPFCGGKANRETGRYALRWAWCENPNCRAFARAELPIDRWNTRPIEDDLRAELAEAKKRLEEYDAAWIGAAETEDALRAELARKDEENNKLLNALWTAEDMVAGWHHNRDSHDKIKELSSAIKSARAAVDGMREGGKS